jgi:thiamine pyrophosphate-dependent acetolactate synthase large subunit-like protein
MTGAEVLIESLRVNGVRHVFGIPSTHTLEFYRALGQTTGIEQVTTSHEQGAAFMADGYARATGRPGVCMVTTGPGVTNAATAIAEAYSDSIPVLCITSHIPSEDIGRGRGHSHELRSQERVLEGITDRSELILSPDRIPDAVHEAFRRFRTGRPRPVCLAIPVDVQEMTTGAVVPPVSTDDRPAPDNESLREAVALLDSAERPGMLVGGGAVAASHEIARLADRFDAPVVTTLNGKGVIPSGHDLAASLAFYRSPARFLETCDVVLAVGTEVSPADFWIGPLRLGGKLIHVDIDPGQIGLNHPVDLALVGDARAAVTFMVGASRPASKQGRRRAAAVRVAAGEEAAELGRPYQPWVSALRKAMPDESILSLDVAMVAGFGAFPFYDLPGPRTWMNPSGLATLGYALPAAIGAKVARPDLAVTALVGDGGFMFTMSELMVAAQHRLPIPIVIWNDRAFGEIHRLMRERGFEPMATDLHVPDLATLAAAYGAAYARADEPEDLAVAVESALAADRPTLVEVPAWS